MVELGQVSRSGVYRLREGNHVPDPDLDLRDAIQRIALEWPSYGRPRITAELRRRGWTVNPKRVQRILREDNLVCVRKRKFAVTTDSNHGRRVYANLASQMMVSDVNQLWVADITYIRLQDEFVFLAVVLDACSRRVIGWELGRTLEDDLTLAALRMALSQRSIQPGLVHHSDRGAQYASNDYTDLLKEHGIDPSMSRKGNPWDNAPPLGPDDRVPGSVFVSVGWRSVIDAAAGARGTKCSEKGCVFPAQPGLAMCLYHLRIFGSPSGTIQRSALADAAHFGFTDARVAFSPQDNVGPQSHER